MPKKQISPEQKVRAVKDYLSGKRRKTDILKTLGIPSRTLQGWIVLYKINGTDGLSPGKIRRSYSKQLKLKVIKEHLQQGTSYFDLCLKYKIKDFNVKANGEIYMAKTRRTTMEKRIEIVTFCLKNNKNYRLVTEKFNISYASSYTWTRKYERFGIDGLKDLRGRRKASFEPNETEKLKTENRKLKTENKILAAKLKNLQIDNELLKKLEE